MEHIIMEIRSIFPLLGGIIGWFIGDVDGMLAALVAFVSVDYITGVLCAFVEKRLSSNVGSKGICKKVMLFLFVGMAHILDMNIIGTGSALRTAVICFYISNEGLSIMENAIRIGIPVPETVRQALGQLGREKK